MKIYQQAWWKKIFKPKEKQKEVPVLKDTGAIIEFLKELHYDVSKILPLLEKLLELEKERGVANETITKVNLETQAEILDELINHYSSFQDDADINGLRLKQISEQFLVNAKRAGLKDLVQEKNKDPKWRLQW